MLFVVDARERIGAGDRFIASRVFALGVPVVIAVNKVDRLKPGHIVTQMETASRLGEFHALHPVSAKTGDGIGELREELVGPAPRGAAVLPASSSAPTCRSRTQISELVREKALHLTKDEIPHALSAEVDEIDEQARRGLDLRRDRLPEADPHRPRAARW